MLPGEVVGAGGKLNLGDFVSIQMHRHSELKRDQPTQVRQNLVVLAFPTSDQAFRLRDGFLKLQGEKLFELTEAVVITRDAQGVVKLHQSSGAVVGCASAGTVVGLIVGLAFLVPGVGSAVGAGVGAVVGRLLELGVDTGFMREVAATIKSGTAAVALLGSQAQIDKLELLLGPLLKGCTLLQASVDPDREAEIRALLARL